jgi:hypothetical protein
MTIKHLKKLRSKLPRGYTRMLMNDTGASSATVSRALREGPVSPMNRRVIEAAIKLAARNKEMLSAQEEHIKSL